MTMNFQFLFDAFTKRNENKIDSLKPLTSEFRYRVRQLCVDIFLEKQPLVFVYTETFWSAMHTKLNYLTGESVSSNLYPRGTIKAVDQYLLTCDDGSFLDFIEMIFQVPNVPTNNEELWHLEHRQNFVKNINQFFQLDDLPYYITGYSLTEGCNPSILEYPKVILLENDVTHSSIAEPALALLANPVFSSANTEFLEALQHYRKGEYGDCLTKTGSSLESVLKIICDQKNWSYNQGDTLSTLLDIIFQESGLDSFFNQPIMLIGTLRNRLSTAHGAGVQNKTVPKHKAQFAVNATASSIILLISECGLAV